MSTAGTVGGEGTVAVVGGGVIGLASAWRLAGTGRSVTLVDPDVGRGASWVAGGMLAPTAEAWVGEEALTELGLASTVLWPAFASEVAADAGRDVGWSARGTLVVARDADDAAQLTRLAEFHATWGLSSERLTGRQARRLEPALGPTTRGALWLPEDHQVDNRLLVEALLAAATARGVRLVAERVTRIQPGTVHLDGGGTVAADVVVATMGAWAPPIDGLAEGAVPVRPVKGQILRVRATDRAVFPTHTVRGLGVYVIPRPHGEIAIGATTEERGFDTSVTAGAVHELLRDAWELLPGLAEATFLEATAGLRPGTPDNLPVVGSLPDAPGVIVATGHHRNGILLAPLTAALVTALAGGPWLGAGPDPTRSLAICDPARFAAATAEEVPAWAGTAP